MMRKLLLLLIGMAYFVIASSGQNYFTLSGIVVDELKSPLPGATVLLSNINKGATTNASGKYSLYGLPKDTYNIEISFIGYKTIYDTIEIYCDTTYYAEVEMATLHLQEVRISDDYVETRKKEETLNMEIVDNRYLKQNLGGSVMNSLERLPGITSIDIGSGQSKPVIRGLGFNRVVIVENSLRHEAQEWGSEHGLEIDQYAIDQIEIVKGPASLMYGSDAIAGVIVMKSKTIPIENTVGGTIDISAKTNNDYLGTSISVYGRKKWFFADLRATFLSYADYKVPTDSIDIYSYRAALYNNHLRNTAGKEENVHLSFGMVKGKFQSTFFLSNIHVKNGFFANAHGLEPRSVDTLLHDKSDRDINYPFQQVNHFKAINSSRYSWGKFKFESDLGFQQNLRQEWSQYVSHGYMPAIFPDTMGFDAELERWFEKKSFTGNWRLTFERNEKTQLVFGVNSDYQNNNIDGRGFIIPSFKQYSVGSYLLAKYAPSTKSVFKSGIRFDVGHIKTAVYYDWFQSPSIIGSDTIWQFLQRADEINRHFSNFTWSAGYSCFPGKWNLKLNIGKSFRMPIAKELAANGVNYHHFSYEVGNAALSPEISWQLDAGIEYSTKKIVVGITPFINYFPNYIYLNPSSEHDRLYGNGNQIYYYTQSSVFRHGAEIHSHYQLSKSFQLGFIAEYVYSIQLSGEKKGFTLPFSPPASAIFNFKYQKLKMLLWREMYFSLDFRLSAAQNRLVPPEERTEGYRVVNLSFGGDVVFRKQKMVISFQIQNALNTKYFNHTSYYRLINVPEPGRNLILNISIPFSGYLTKNKTKQ